MHKFVIERDIAGVGNFNSEELRTAAQKSNCALKELAPDIQWIQSYVVNNKTFCIYFAKSAEIIRKHAARSGLPASRITEVRAVIDPTAAAR